MSRRRRRGGTAPPIRPAASQAAAGPRQSAGRGRHRAASTSRRRQLVVGALGALIGVVVVVAAGLAVLRPGAGTAAVAGDAASGSSMAGGTVVGTDVGERAPDFQLVDIDGRTVTRESLAGKPALLWFTASYCAPCNEAMPVLKQILEPLGPDAINVVVVFVDPAEPPDTLRRWRETIGSPDWTAGIAPAPMIRDYSLQYLDTKYLLDANGVIRETDVVPLREDVWRPAIERVVRGA